MVANVCWHDAAMKVSAEISYPTATPDQAYQLTIDADFRGAVCEATHAIDYDVDVTEHADGTTTVVVSRTMPADLPDALKKFVGDKVSVVQTENWGDPDADGRRTADLEVRIKGQPATMKGTATIVTDGAGATIRIEGNLTVAIPFFGKKIEPEIAKGIYAAVKKEQETGRSWLS